MEIADTARRQALEEIVLDLGKLQGKAKVADESFVALLIASAQREATVRCQEVTRVLEHATESNCAPAFLRDERRPNRRRAR
jgi:hypothetical protein